MRIVATSLALIAAAITNVTMIHQLPQHLVTTSGQKLMRDGRPFRFVGVNCYRLMEFSRQADRIFTTFHDHGVGVVRFWAFPNHNAGGADFTRLDRLVAAAKRHDILLLPVLENHWPDCTDRRTVKPRDWYQAGWRQRYRPYLLTIGARYRDEEQILGWQLINEPEIYPDTEENFAVLRAFASEAAHALKSVDDSHLMSLGLLGLGQPSTAGPRYRALQDFDAINVVSAHDHGYMDEPLPGRGWHPRPNSLYADLSDARALRKPFIATEAGIPLAWVDNDRSVRAQKFQAKLDAFFAAGGSGYILWNYEPWPDTDYGFDDSDPVMDVLTKVSARL